METAISEVDIEATDIIILEALEDLEEAQDFMVVIMGDMAMDIDIDPDSMHHGYSHFGL